MMNESKSTEVRQSLKSLSLAYCLVLAATIFTIFSNNVAVPTEAFLLGFGFDVVLQGSFRVLGLLTVAVLLYSLVALPVLGRQYHVTDDQIQEVRGLLSRTIRSARLDQVYAVRVEESPLGRLFGYGNVVLEYADQSVNNIVLKGVDTPQSIATLVEYHIDRAGLRSNEQVALRSASSLINELIEEVREMHIARIELQTRIEAYLDRREQLDTIQNEVLHELAGRMEHDLPIISEVVPEEPAVGGRTISQA
ncbi:PH domain-containing protein [Marinobacter adhaerens]|uniref:Membrane protein containing DUF304, prokaryotic transmembrane adjacent region n=1 Tax=Marinobacter adhaerens (strain DSM 23420 / HP15) TaxID=225937 RepID=E4PS32_MARAH|nr:PH domain-containing protein [Marinobacter adhaerens]ADQ00067.1 membrane protein containing DUF304, prokaryotic transmembrane adjacent region [Marinobacter adhaerens HP15]